jgi:hypothetical protein
VHRAIFSSYRSKALQLGALTLNDIKAARLFNEIVLVDPPDFVDVLGPDADTVTDHET